MVGKAAFVFVTVKRSPRSRIAVIVDFQHKVTLKRLCKEILFK